MRLRAEATASGGATYELSTRPVDVIRWEAATKKKIGDGPGFTDMARMLYFAGQREGNIPEDTSFKDWYEGLEGLEVLSDDPPVPTQQEA